MNPIFARDGGWLRTVRLLMTLGWLATSHAAAPSVGAAADPAAQGSVASCSAAGDWARRPVGELPATGPPNPDGPTPVSVGVTVLELRSIDAVQDDYSFRGYVRSTWCDPRRAFDPALEGREQKVYIGPAAKAFVEEFWWPAGFPVNQSGQMVFTERVIRVHHDGTIDQDLNANMQLMADFDFHRFPFDRQLLTLDVESITWDRDRVRFVTDEARTGFAADFEIPEWKLLDVAAQVDEVSVLRSDTPFSRFRLEMTIARESGFYLWKVILPLAMIVALSWSVFWMTEEPLAGRSRISATGVLTIVAYQFVVAEDLPRVAYLTLLDKIMVVSFCLLAVTVVQSMWVSLHQQTNIARARRIDRTARWVFPLVYLVVIAGVVLSTPGA